MSDNDLTKKFYVYTYHLGAKRIYENSFIESASFTKYKFHCESCKEGVFSNFGYNCLFGNICLCKTNKWKNFLLYSSPLIKNEYTFEPILLHLSDTPLDFNVIYNKFKRFYNFKTNKKSTIWTDIVGHSIYHSKIVIIKPYIENKTKVKLIKVKTNNWITFN
ncbi:hypothetical protein ACW95P_01860 [Candidatus Mycoplasma pogonae]